MDFYRIAERSLKKDSREVYPEFKVTKSKDLMVRGKSFYAVWDEEAGLWSTDQYDIQRIVDDDLRKYREQMVLREGERVSVKYTANYSSAS